MPPSKPPKHEHTPDLFVHGLAFPLASRRDGCLQGFSQSIEVGHVVAIDRPGLGFLLGMRWFAISGNADALAIREKFLFDARQLLPAHLNYLSITTTLNQCCWLQFDCKGHRGHDAQVDDKTQDK